MSQVSRIAFLRNKIAEIGAFPNHSRALSFLAFSDLRPAGSQRVWYLFQKGGTTMGAEFHEFVENRAAFIHRVRLPEVSVREFDLAIAANADPDFIRAEFGHKLQFANVDY